MIRAGDLKTRCQIQRKIRNSVNEFNESLDTDFATIDRRWGNFEAIRSTETDQGGKVENITEYKIIFRFNPNLLSSDRLKVNDDIFNISSIISNQDKTETTVYARMIL